MSSNRHVRLTARLEDSARRLGSSVQPVPVLAACLEMLLDHVPAERATDLIDRYGELHPLARSEALADPALQELYGRPLAGLPRLERALAALLSGPGWDSTPAELFAAHPDTRSLLGAGYFGVSVEPGGLSRLQREDIAARLAGGTPVEVLLDRHLAAPLAHMVARGRARTWEGGWPCWTLREAAVTHVHRQAAPEHLFPTTPGEALAGYRHFAMLGAHLALWIGEDKLRAVALEGTSADLACGEATSRALALADLQAWLARGGSNLGPAWSDPTDWLRLMWALRENRMGLRKLGELGVSVETAAESRDMLAAARKQPWTDLSAWHRDPDQADQDLVAAAVGAMFTEDATLHGLVAAPSDPPAGELVLDTTASTLSATPRSHRQYTEPASWVLSPSWCGALHRRGLRTLRLTGCRHEHRELVTQRLQELATGTGSLPEELELEIASSGGRMIPPPSARQVRPSDRIVAFGGGLSARLAEQLRQAHFNILPCPLGPLRDPISLAAALQRSLEAEDTETDEVVEESHGWRVRTASPSEHQPSGAMALLQTHRRLAWTRQRIKEHALVWLGWSSAWVARGEPVLPADRGPRRLLTVSEIVRATRAALEALRSHAGVREVLLTLDPSEDPELSATDDQVGQATLLLAAHELARSGHVTLLPTLAIAQRELRDHAFYEGGQLTPAAERLLLDRILDGHVAPAARAWARAKLDSADGAVPAELSAHPFLPQPSDVPDLEDTLEVPAETAVVRSDGWGEQLGHILEPGWVGYDELDGWLLRLTELLDHLPEDDLDARLRTLSAMADKSLDLADANVLAPGHARLLRELLGLAAPP